MGIPGNLDKEKQGTKFLIKLMDFLWNIQGAIIEHNNRTFASISDAARVTGINLPGIGHAANVWLSLASI
jgi:hypothetical protein